MWQRLAARVLFVDLDVVAVDMHVVGGRVRPAVWCRRQVLQNQDYSLESPFSRRGPTTFADRHDVNIVPAMQPEGCGRSRPKM